MLLAAPAIPPLYWLLMALLGAGTMYGTKKMEVEGQKGMQKMGGKLARQKQASEQKALMALKERETGAQKKEREFQMEMRELGVEEGREKAALQRGAMEAQGERQLQAAAIQALNRTQPRVPLSSASVPMPPQPAAQPVMDLAQLAQMLQIPMSTEMRI